jgi:hypothetical protein|tara:strand:+ start:211 stop:585 length:375 start_codon:yes stop_codon:yes gene_type:complete
MIKLIDILTEGNKYGFDLTDFKPGGFHKVLSVLKIKPKGKLVKSKYDVYQWEWKGSGILIVTANNPITGEYASEPGKPARKKDRNYASYMGVEGKPDKVQTAVGLIKQNASHIKGEDPRNRSYI